MRKAFPRVWRIHTVLAEPWCFRTNLPSPSLLFWLLTPGLLSAFCQCWAVSTKAYGRELEAGLYLEGFILAQFCEYPMSPGHILFHGCRREPSMSLCSGKLACPHCCVEIWVNTGSGTLVPLSLSSRDLLSASNWLTNSERLCGYVLFFLLIL